ncbi:peptidylprolyl isomerase [Nonomuraea zeae]|uniref:Peptidyl-prolyl cis-trans isomerase n=1 Tax=Nonomuraea zeae TaxID=1642303 RepID=A0A5S4G6F7_9ACTN|nr:peptidylprolyl isomerase [Nonomuraea zeae]TMR28074.1 peptidylprolyl isomerase [Nonomuraea zeae]
MAEKLIANLKTNHGTIKVELFPNQAPKTVRNFVELAEGTREWTHPGTGEKGKGPYYNNTIFHRIISGFMIQGGDILGQGIGGPGYEFDDEIHPDLYFNRPYLLAMANAGVRGGRGTNGSQFFITLVPTPHLNGKHTIFGEVIEGQEVVDAVGKTQTDRRDKPLNDVVLESVTIDRVQG